VGAVPRLDWMMEEVTQAQAVKPNESVTGDVRLHEFHSRVFRNTRRLRVWLPPRYDAPGNETRQYPVLYLNDGQNLFDRATAFGGVEWQVDETADRLIRQEVIPPLIIVGILMGFSLIMIEVKSPMLFAVGMYLPVETTFAIFIGGIFRWITDRLRDRANLNDAQKARVENAGVLTASGMIAGEALLGIVIAVTTQCPTGSRKATQCLNSGGFPKLAV